MERAPGVRNVENDAAVAHAGITPNDPRWDRQWALRRIAAPEAWSVTTGDASIIVAVLDTGVDARHPDLEGAVLAGQNAVAGGSDTSDRHGHGTYVAGIIAARTNNGVGVASLCWTCSILPVKVLSDDGTGSSSDVAEGIIWAADNGAHVINLSLGASSGTRVLEKAVEYASEQGVVVVSAGGNHGSADPVYPAAYGDAVGVAATDETDRRYIWSNYGSWLDVAAPGCNESTGLDGIYQTFCGTSSATPVVAGLAALTLSAQNVQDAKGVVTAMRETAVDIGPVVAYGRVDASTTVRSVLPMVVPACTDGTPVTGDWIGDGEANFGCFSAGQWRLHHPGGTVLAFTYGVQAGDVPVTGDWNGNGIDGVGVYRHGGEWHLRNSLSAARGQTVHSFVYGMQAGDVPVTGDWNANGIDGPGVVRSDVWYLRNKLSGSGGTVMTLYGK